MTAYLVYDVFTDRKFGGNQLAVIPDATGLAEDDLQRIAREFNFSETTFVTPAADPAHTARVRIFTPTMEVPFAGHPTIGTAVALAEAGHGPEMVLELGVGPLAARAEAGRAEFITEVPLARLAAPDPDLVARALGIAPDRIKSAPVMASLGLGFTLTELDSRETLAALQTDVAAFREGAAAYPQGQDFAQYAWVETPDGIHARMFAPLDNIPEDPATGSAAATLAALLAEARGAYAGTLRQGEDMGRPSTIGVEAVPGRVTVSGRALRVMEGRLL
ncbi:MAG: PhzF family phenazine biosynthesis protein [Maritimibacter sp.]|nr:PhzF family phenazine biosynthesis protein [Maritimibacter sp.]